MFTCVIKIILNTKEFTGIQKQKDNFKYHSALRPSLFSNMPPYIRFSSYNIKGINIQHLSYSDKIIYF